VKNLIDLNSLYEAKKSFTLDLRLIAKSIPILLFAKHPDVIVGAYLKDHSASLTDKQSATKPGRQSSSGWQALSIISRLFPQA